MSSPKWAEVSCGPWFPAGSGGQGWGSGSGGDSAPFSRQGGQQGPWQRPGGGQPAAPGCPGTQGPAAGVPALTHAGHQRSAFHASGSVHPSSDPGPALPAPPWPLRVLGEGPTEPSLGPLEGPAVLASPPGANGLEASRCEAPGQSRAELSPGAPPSVPPHPASRDFNAPARLSPDLCAHLATSSLY